MPRRVRAPAGARKRRKASVKKKQRNTAPGFNALDPKIEMLPKLLPVKNDYIY